MRALWHAPAAGAVVRDGAGRQTRSPDGKVSKKRGRAYTWLLCDVCLAGSWVGGLAPDQERLSEEQYRKDHGRPCRMTPRCSGRHLLSRDPEVSS